jgi:polysaccharide deacetylase family protein (PEP-CTERM system associated)
MKDRILLTIDVEDWFQVENLKPWIPFSAWSSCELRVEKSIHTLLSLLDSMQNCRSSHLDSAKDSSKATFFILGWIAKKLPHLIKEISRHGHEVASHGYNHNLYSDLSVGELKSELSDSKNRLEDITGSPVLGHRAPSFSINKKILEIISECGYLYDSSYNSFSWHGRYGSIDVSNRSSVGITIRIFDHFYELPISNIKMNGMVLPMGGGAYFRLMPFFLFKMGIKRVLSQEGAYLFYLHPWEVDPDQPRVRSAFLSNRFRHYANLKTTRRKLVRLLQSFPNARFTTCRQYLHETVGTEESSVFPQMAKCQRKKTSNIKNIP